MYCRNCGKEINDTASFCPYCGVMVAIARPEVKIETVHQGMNISNENKEEELPVYKRKNKAAFLVAFIPLICIICRIGITIWGIVGFSSRAQPRNSYPILEYVDPDEVLENNEGVRNE